MRPYALVQFYPMVAIPLVLTLFRPRYWETGSTRPRKITVDKLLSMGK